MTFVALDARHHVDKDVALRRGQTDGIRRDVRIEDLHAIPGTPVAYWAPESMLRAFRELTRFGDGPYIITRTNSLDQDFRFARCNWEVLPQLLDKLWWTWAKGGEFGKYYRDLEMVIAWDHGRATYPGFLGTRNRPLARPASSQYFWLSERIRGSCSAG